MKTKGPLLFFGIALLVTLVACKRHEGDKCKGGESLCEDKTTALTCQGGKLTKVGCGGALGCNRFQDHANCDTSIAEAGDACMGTAEEEYACSANHKRALVCKGSRFERFLECRGAGGCSQLGQQVACDTSLAAKNDPCKSQGAIACAEDGKEMLICRDGKFALYRFCRGQQGCKLKNEAPVCDVTLSLEQDPCGLPGQVVCSVDGQFELLCQGSTFLRGRACRKSGCRVTNRTQRPVECD